jgi:hypothetical protein
MLADIQSWLFVRSVSCERLKGGNVHCGQNLTNKAHARAAAIVQVQERPVERRPELGAQPFPSWAWQAQGSPHVPLHHSAASSGFSTAAGANGGMPLPSHPPAQFPTTTNPFFFP